jgi:hypothetical protein
VQLLTAAVDILDIMDREVRLVVEEVLVPSRVQVHQSILSLDHIVLMVVMGEVMVAVEVDHCMLFAIIIVLVMVLQVLILMVMDITEDQVVVELL